MRLFLWFSNTVMNPCENQSFGENLKLNLPHETISHRFSTLTFAQITNFQLLFKHRNHMVDFLEKKRGFFVRLLARKECIDCFFSIVPPFFCHRTIERGAFTFIMKSLNESRKYFGTVSNYPFSILAAAKKKTFIDSHIIGGWKPYKMSHCEGMLHLHTGCPNKFGIRS